MKGLYILQACKHVIHNNGKDTTLPEAIMNFYQEFMVKKTNTR